MNSIKLTIKPKFYDSTEISFLGWLKASYDNMVIQSFFIYSQNESNISFYKIVSMPPFTKVLKEILSKTIMTYLNSIEVKSEDMFEYELTNSEILLYSLQAELGTSATSTHLVFSKMSELRSLIISNFGEEFYNNAGKYGDYFQGERCSQKRTI